MQRVVGVQVRVVKARVRRVVRGVKKGEQNKVAVSRRAVLEARIRTF